MKIPFLFSVGAILTPLFLAALESHSFAQATASAAAQPAFTPGAEISRLHACTNVIYDEPGDGRLWAVGGSWKASFGADGAVYFPRVGSSEPRRLPHALSPDLVTIGGEPVVFERAVHALRDADRVELDRGSFIERYDLAPGSVEQSFVFTSLPRAGDLILRIPVASELAAVETSSGLEFRSERGRITYSRAVVVDARGRRTDAATHIADGAITIRVGADVLAEAALPLVIDPVLTAIFPESTAADTFAADVAYDAFHAAWVVVYEQVFSATDHDVYAKAYGNTGNLLSQNAVEVSVDSWVGPRIADLAFAHKFLIVAGATFATGGAKTVRGRIAQPNGALLSMDPQISISGGLGGACIRPDIGGDPSTTSAGRWCVVFEQDLSGSDHTIVYSTVSSNGSVTDGPHTLPFMTGSLDADPSVSKSNDGSAWLITWRRVSTFGVSIMGARASSIGTTQNPFVIGGGTFAYSPCASSPITGTNLTAVAYQLGNPVLAGGSTIQVALLDGGTVLQSADLMTLEGSPTASEGQIEPSVDSDGQHFLVSYSEFDSVSHYEMFVTDLAVAGNTLQVSQNHHYLQAGLGRDQRRSNVAAARTGGTLAHRYLVVYDNRLNDTNHDVAGRFFDGVIGGPASAFCLGDGTGTACPCGNSGAAGRGCANSALASGAQLELFSGPASTLADMAVLKAEGVPPGGTGLFFQGTTAAVGSAFGDGLLCASGTIVRLAVKTATPAGVCMYPQAGDATTLSVAGGVPQAGGLRTYQFWYRDSASFCTSATFNLSNGFAIQWAR